MNITSKSRYGIKIMLDLAKFDSSNIQQRHCISVRQSIPQDYMDHILPRLKEHGLIQTIRGRSGGITLNKPANEISLWDIFHAVEDSLYPVQCLDESNENNCELTHQCTTKRAWDFIFNSMKSHLTGISLENLLSICGTSPGNQKLNVINHALSPSLNIMECRGPKKSLLQGKERL